MTIKTSLRTFFFLNLLFLVTYQAVAIKNPNTGVDYNKASLVVDYKKPLPSGWTVDLTSNAMWGGTSPMLRIAATFKKELPWKDEPAYIKISVGYTEDNPASMKTFRWFYNKFSKRTISGLSFDD